MADRPILFSGPMVRALLAGTKTQTRRTIQLPEWATDIAYDAFHGWRFNSRDHSEPLRLRIDEGDRLWVRESWRCEAAFDERAPSALPLGDIVAVQYEADGARHMWLYDHLPAGRLRPSLHMPRRFSRITLTVTDVRVERLQEISEADACAEGAYIAPKSGRVADSYAAMAIAGEWFASGRGWYRNLWDRINGDGSWDTNPWVAAYTFTVQRGNIDQLEVAA